MALSRSIVSLSKVIGNPAETDDPGGQQKRVRLPTRLSERGAPART